MTLADYVAMLRRRWSAIALCAVLGLAVAAGATVLMPLSYQATSESFVASASVGADATSGAIYSGSQFAVSQVQSYAQLVSSPKVLQPVIDELGLSASLQQMRSQVTASSPSDSVLLDVTATASSAPRAADISNAVSRQLGTVIEQLASTSATNRPLVKVTLTQPAVPPLTPSSPRPKLNLALGLIAGLAVGVAFTVLRQQLDTSVSTPDDLQAITATSPLGVIESVKDPERSALTEPADTSVYAEGFKAIRTNLAFVDVDNPPRTIVVTSAMPAEGKTTTSCNLALAMAQAGASVCIVEADLRRPRVADCLGIEARVGLTNVLAGQHELDEVLIPWRRGSVSVLVAGTLPSDASGMLASQAMSSLLAELAGRFDMVVIDVPPVLPVPDAAVMARMADGALLVARYRHTSRDQVRRAVEKLDAADARLLGTVLTFVPMKGRLQRSYGYGYAAQPAPARGDGGRHRGRDGEPEGESVTTDGSRAPAGQQSGLAGARRSGSALGARPSDEG